MSNLPSYFKVALLANLIGILGLLYLMLKVILPEFFVGAEEYEQNQKMYDIRYFTLLPVYLIFSAILIIPLTFSSQNNTQGRRFAMVSIPLGVAASLLTLLFMFSGGSS